MTFSGKRIVLLAILFVTLLTTNLWAQNPRRFHYMGTSIFAMPTGFTRSTMSYINDSGHSAVLISQSLMNNFLEVSMLRHMNDAESGKSVMNFKLKLIEEDLIIPSIVWGVSDVNTQLGSKIFYFAASKSIEAFGVHLHAGFYKDPITTDKKTFFGFEKMVFPLVTVGAERNDEIDTFGIKLSPYPGLSIEIAQRDRKEELYNLNYIRSF
ncbi:MAG: hypothetical protein PWR01_2211 [Clostridiales bacterium]|nr:hypothetical protein [Clostridiales bacterium]MDN5281138.1 hypothetical protein [Candidatus Ozemobacter sp.]